MLGLQPDYLLRLSRRTTVVFAFSPSTPQSNAFRRRSQLLIVTAHQAEPNFRNASICDGEVTLWVKLRRPQYEHMFSALPSNSDIAGCSRHVSNVPTGDITLISRAATLVTFGQSMPTLSSRFERVVARQPDLSYNVQVERSAGHGARAASPGRAPIVGDIGGRRGRLFAAHAPRRRGYARQTDSAARGQCYARNRRTRRPHREEHWRRVLGGVSKRGRSGPRCCAIPDTHS